MADVTKSERLAVIAYCLACDGQVIVREMMEKLEIERRTVRRDMVTLSRVLPVYEEGAGVWRVLEHGRQSKTG